MRISEIKTILITGANGVLATHLSSRLSQRFQFIRAVRNPSKQNEIKLNSWQFEEPSQKIDLVLHFAGKYLIENSIEAEKEVYDSVVGTAAVVANYCGQTGTPLIALGSYFEKAPEHLQPWSYYASAKKSASELLVLESLKRNFKLRYVYCYDTYGPDLSRRKIVDVLLSETTSHLELSEGLQKMNLTHFDDFISAIELLIEDILTQDTLLDFYQIKNPNDELTLREIVNQVNSVKKEKIEVRFGAKPYRDKEVFEVWQSAQDVPKWSPTVTFSSFIREYLGSTNE